MMAILFDFVRNIILWNGYTYDISCELCLFTFLVDVKVSGMSFAVTPQQQYSSAVWILKAYDRQLADWLRSQYSSE